LDQLAVALALQKQLLGEKALIEARFGPLQDKYNLLAKFEVISYCLR
jgi:hypothetical protein